MAKLQSEVSSFKNALTEQTPIIKEQVRTSNILIPLKAAIETTAASFYLPGRLCWGANQLSFIFSESKVKKLGFCLTYYALVRSLNSNPTLITQFPLYTPPPSLMFSSHHEQKPKNERMEPSHGLTLHNCICVRGLVSPSQEILVGVRLLV